MSARLRLTLSYAGFLLIAGAALIALLFYLLRFVPESGSVVSADGQFVPGRIELLDALWPRVWQVLAMLAAVGLIGGWFLAGRMLRPLTKINAVAERVADGSLDHRVSMTGPKDEFRHLADTFDSMLDRLQHAFEEQRRFAANASHELRTPYAVERAMLDVALADPAGVDTAQLVRRLDQTNRRGSETLAALLTLSQLDHSDDIGEEPVDVASVTAAAVDEVRPLATNAGITMSSSIEEGDTDGRTILVRQLVMNLLLNGIRHNIGPDGGTLEVSTRTYTDDRVELVISNSGPVIPPDMLSTLIEPFVRGVGRISGAGGKDNDMEGSGLGLALVARIAEVHHAELVLDAPAAGGLRARVVFPGPGHGPH